MPRKGKRVRSLTEDLRLRRGLSELDPLADPVVAKSIASAVEAELDKNLTAIRSI
jgi:hypothetical protein